MVDAKEQDKEPIMISAIQHWSYCPRQCGLIHVEQIFDDNVHTMRGNVEHERVDDPGFDVLEGVRVERALPVWSEELGLVGKCDIVEFHPDGLVYPIEYKHGKKREKIHDDLQLAAQAICLEEMMFPQRRRRDKSDYDVLPKFAKKLVNAFRSQSLNAVLI